MNTSEITMKKLQELLDKPIAATEIECDIKSAEEYAAKKGVAISELTPEEKSMFIRIVED